MAIRAAHRNPIRSVARSIFLSLGKIKRFVIELMRATSTRNSPTTVLGYGPTAVYTDDPILLTVPANLVAIKYGRLVGTEWFDTDINGVKFPNPTELQNYGAGTNYYWPSQVPVTKDTGSLGIGTYTLSCYGAGSALASGGTATITGAASATEGSPNTIEVTVAGTVTITITGALDRVQLEGGSIETAHIITTTTPVSRLADVTTVPTPSVLTPESGAIEMEFSPYSIGGQIVWASYIDGANNDYITYGDGIGFKFVKDIVSPRFDISFVAGDIILLQFYWDSVLGVGIRAAKNGADITAEAFVVGMNFVDLHLSTVLDIGNRNGANLFQGDYANEGEPITWASAQDAGWL